MAQGGAPSSRSSRAALGQSTLDIIQQHQGYSHPDSGQHVSLAAAIQHCVEGSQFIAAGDQVVVPSQLKGRFRTTITVTSRSTLEACRLLAQGAPDDPPPMALNFASARHPGGGFLNGSQAQEESLARSSALYASQTSDRCNVFYESHSERGPGTWLYSDAAIVTPACPVFRSDDGSLLEQPYLVTFVTCAAPNLSAMLQGAREGKGSKEAKGKKDKGGEGASGPKALTPKEAELKATAEAALVKRAKRVLAIAAAARCTRLVLGAWGAGVFGHDPLFVAQAWREVLREEAVQGVFELVEFAALDRADVFRTVFG